MSRAVFAVLMNGSTAALGPVAQNPAMSRTTAARAATSPASRAYGGMLVT